MISFSGPHTSLPSSRAAWLYVSYPFTLPQRIAYWSFEARTYDCPVLPGLRTIAQSIVFRVNLNHSSVHCMTFHQYARVRDTLILFLYALGENFGYRHLHVAWHCLRLKDSVVRREEWRSIVRQAYSRLYRRIPGVHC